MSIKTANLGLYLMFLNTIGERVNNYCIPFIVRLIRQIVYMEMASALIKQAKLDIGASVDCSHIVKLTTDLLGKIYMRNLKENSKTLNIPVVSTGSFWRKSHSSSYIFSKFVRKFCVKKTLSWFIESYKEAIVLITRKRNDEYRISFYNEMERNFHWNVISNVNSYIYLKGIKMFLSSEDRFKGNETGENGSIIVYLFDILSVPAEARLSVFRLCSKF